MHYYTVHAPVLSSGTEEGEGGLGLGGVPQGLPKIQGRGVMQGHSKDEYFRSSHTLATTGGN